jgi:hypothetical protein
MQSGERNAPAQLIFGGQTMNIRKYQEALVSLERLHWHLHLNGDPDLWTAELLRKFKDVAQEDDADEEIVYLGEELPSPAA